MRGRYRRPDWVRRLNAMGDACGGAHHVVPLDADELVAAARAGTGLDDFGDLGDGDWRGRLVDLVAAVETGGLHVVGRLMTREELLRGLRTRLLLAELRRRDPGVAEEQVEAPLVITGPARSGTSILFELLALDERAMSPVAADVLHLDLPGGPDRAARMAMSEAEQELWADVQPEFAAIHELRSDLPVEDITLSSPSFAGSHWSMVMQEPGGWAPDPVADFAFHRAVLQAVQHLRPDRPGRRWVLKTPGHLIMLDALYEAYPDALLVLTHRDPARTMPSTVSTTAMVQWLRTDDVDLDGLSALIGAVFTGALNDVAQRHASGRLPGRFGDVHFPGLMADPTEAIRRALDMLGLEMTDAHAAAVTRYLGHKPRGKHGVHTYTAEEWGFDADDLRRDCSTYMTEFGVAEEG
jgi:hypothetical protein